MARLAAAVSLSIRTLTCLSCLSYSFFIFGSARADIRELSPLWTNTAEVQLPPVSAVPPGTDRSQFTVITSYPVAVIERAHRIARRSKRGFATIRKLEFPSTKRLKRSNLQFEPTSVGEYSNPVLEKYPGSPRLWTPYTEDPTMNGSDRKNKPLFVPDSSFLLEHVR